MADPTSGNRAASSNLTYEETPIIDVSSGGVVPAEPSSVIPEAARVFGETPPAHVQKAPQSGHEAPPYKAQTPGRPAGKRHIGTILFVVLLFGLGIWLSAQLRSFFAPEITDEVAVPTVTPFLTDDRAPIVPISSPSGIPSSSTWQTYQVTNGRTRSAIPDVTYQLPSNVTAPTCDSQNCASQGTNLPGGTRFTVAARGKGQLLPDFRGAILTDAGGREFTMKQGVFGGVYAYEYTGEFTGRTGGGYAFARIRGVLMPVSESLAVEFNHFSPSGIETDFAADDALFDKIIQSFRAGSASGTPSVHLPTSTPVASPAAF